MAIQECENGHIYDNALHESCPYCEKIDRIDFGDSYDIGRTVAATGVNDSDIGKTVAATGAVDSDIGKTVAATGAVDSDIGKTVAATGAVDSDIEKTVASTVNTDIGVTVAPASYRSEPENSDLGKTVGVYHKKTGFEAVVGWLVCIDGAQKGKDYRIYGRINSIGRDERMDVCLRGDESVSRENHAKLAYDKRHNAFHIIPVDDEKSIYLNDEPVYVPTKLKARDVIEIGNYKLYFVPLCDEKFTWDSDKKDGNN